MLLTPRLLTFSLFIFPILLLGSCQSDSGEIENKTTDTTQVSVEKPATNPNPAKLIIPGKSIGLTHLYESADSVFQISGKPDSSDAAMGKMMASWYKNNHETHIFFSRNMGNADETSRAKQIRITSPYFVTANGISVGEPLDSIQKYRPNINKTASYFSPKSKSNVSIYDDLQGGIAFEIDVENNCIGINIHKPGEEGYETYIAFFPDFSKINQQK